MVLLAQILLLLVEGFHKQTLAVVMVLAEQALELLAQKLAEVVVLVVAALDILETMLLAVQELLVKVTTAGA
jgi:hypothetical protein